MTAIVLAVTTTLALAQDDGSLSEKGDEGSARYDGRQH
jgi:hypothetical protein